MKILSTWSQFQNWLFNYPNKLDLNLHNSLTSKTALIILRIIALLILSFRYLLQIQQYYQSAFTIVQYLTEFGFALTWQYFLVTIQDYLLNKNKPNISKLLKDWINLLFEVAICMEIVVTILFWAVLYNYSRPFQIIAFLKEVGVHGFPFLCLLLDLMLNTYQFPKRHLIVIVAVGLSYLALNIIYSFAVKPIYTPLDWISLMCYIYIVICLLLVIGFHTLIRKFWEKYRQPKLVLLGNESQSILDGDIQ